MFSLVDGLRYVVFRMSGACELVVGFAQGGGHGG